MIVYQADKRQFIRDTFQNDIEDVLAAQYLRTTGRKAQPAEFRAWANSLYDVSEVLKDPGIPDDMGVALEYTVPQTSKRIDVLLAVEDAGGVSVVELKFAAGHFSELQALENGASEWVELPEWITPQPGMLATQVVGQSMNKRIPNGAWCLFRANPQGTRNGKIVVVQNRSISDPETGGSYTVKRYKSEKGCGCGWGGSIPGLSSCLSQQ